MHIQTLWLENCMASSFDVPNISAAFVTQFTVALFQNSLFLAVACQMLYFTETFHLQLIKIILRATHSAQTQCQQLKR